MIRKTLVAIAFLFGLLPCLSWGQGGETYLESFLRETAVEPKNEIRAAWVVRYSLSSKEDVDLAVDYAENARFHLLFVQVRGRGDAYYRSSLEPEGQKLRRPIAEFDPFDYFLSRCHAVGIAVHAWINTYYVWSDPNAAPPPGHIVSRHPEWLVADRGGVRQDERPLEDWLGENMAGYFLSPGLSSARDHTTAVIAEIVERYPVDGIHLDYIRYPNNRFDYSDDQRTAFALRYGVDPFDFLSGEGFPGGRDPDALWRKSPGARAFLDSVFTEWRSSQVDSLVRSVRSAIGDVALSAAVVPDAERARVEKGQNWVKWVQDGLVDFVVPMAYTYEPGDLLELTTRIERMVGRERYILGLPVYGGRERYLGYSVSLLRHKNIIGYSLFSYNELEKQPFSLRFLDRVFFGPGEE
jgi:uncharacterized lipoprotein YddW (UPF0748 family)